MAARCSPARMWRPAGARRPRPRRSFRPATSSSRRSTKKDGDEVEKLLGKPGSTMINTRDVTSGETALHIVTARRDIVWMVVPRSTRAPIRTSRDNRGMTPLMLASQLGFVEGVELLLIKAGARVDEPNEAGETPLISAVHRRDTADDAHAAEGRGRSRPGGQLGPLGARLCPARGRRAARLIAEIERNAKPSGAAAPDIGPSLRADVLMRMAAADDRTLDELRLALAPDDRRAPRCSTAGATAALRQAAALAGVDPAVARLAFPGGAMDMIAAWIDCIDAAMQAALGRRRAGRHCKIRERIRRARCSSGSTRSPGTRRRCAARWRSMAMPQNLARALQLGWHSADLMWRLAGDTATDYNHYTKRAILSGIYARRWRCWSRTRARARPRPAPSSTGGSTA